MVTNAFFLPNLCSQTFRIDKKNHFFNSAGDYNPAHESNLVSPQILPGLVKSHILLDFNLEPKLILVETDWISENDNHDIKVLLKPMNLYNPSARP